jgi:hypothetical protein
VLGRAEHRLERASLVLFVAAAAACAAHLVWHGPVGPWLSAIGAGLPAWAAAIHGVLGHAELTRLTQRSQAMSARLSDLAARLESIAPEHLTYRGLAEIAGAAAREMLLEHDDWQALSRGSEVPLP